MISFPAKIMIAFAGLTAVTAQGAGWCHNRFQSAEGYSISVDFQVHGRPSRAGYYRADPIWINVSGPGLNNQSDLAIELTDIAAHGNESRNQVLAFNLTPADGGQRFTGDGKLSTSANESQKIRVRVGDQWLQNPANGNEEFAFNMGYALWDVTSACRMD